jgi:CRP-like cAMP-binding protein
VPIFAPLPPPTLERLAQAMVEARVEAGSTVLEEGDHGDLFYVIADGKAVVESGGRRLRTLERGDFFGEIALLRDTPRTATVRAREETHVLALSREQFVPAVAGYAPARGSADAVIGLRLGPGRATFVPP